MAGHPPILPDPPRRPPTVVARMSGQDSISPGSPGRVCWRRRGTCFASMSGVDAAARFLRQAPRSNDDLAFLLGRLGFPGATEVGPIDFDMATSVEVLGDLEGELGAAVAPVDGWVSIWGPLLVADPEAVADLSRGGAALTLMLEGASG